MRPLVYDVAISVDGFIAGPDHDLSPYLYEGDHVPAYMARLSQYDATLMGRHTYTAGYAFGLEPGQRAYPHMEHYVFSRTLELPADSPVRLLRDDPVGFTRDLKASEGGTIYLCGGGSLAGQLLSAGLIDTLILKINPVALGGGTPLFGAQPAPANMRLIDTHVYDSGVTLVRYALSDHSVA